MQVTSFATTNGNRLIELTVSFLLMYSVEKTDSGARGFLDNYV